MTRELKTERHILRPFIKVEAHELQESYNDFAVAKWLAHIPHPYTLEDANAFIERQKSALAITYNGNLIGAIGNVGEFGYWLKQDAWGNGFETESGHAYLAELFNTGHSNISSGYFEGNTASKHVLEKLGFQPSDQKKVQTPIYDSIIQHNMMMTKNDWYQAHGLPIDLGDIILRPNHPSDVTYLQKIGGAENVAPMTSVLTSPWPTKDVENWVYQRRFQANATWNMVIVDAGTDQPIGCVGVGGAPLSLYYFIDPDHWGRGIATRAASALLMHIFAYTQTSEIIADSFVDNPGSVRILENLGFKHIGNSLGQSQARLEPAPVILYRLTRTDFESQSA